MKVLFIGGTGTISRACSLGAIKRGCEVTLLHRGSSKVPEGVREFIADVGDEQKVNEFLSHESFDAVAQFIAYRKEDIERDFRLFRGRTKQYLFISSASVYKKPLLSPFLTEEVATGNPFWNYAQEKAEAEQRLMELAQKEGFFYTIVRPSHTYDGRKVPLALHGRGGSWQTLLRMQRGEEVILPDDGNSLWTLTHADDFAKGFVELLGNPKAYGEIFHITTDESMTWNGIYSVIAAELGVELKVRHVASDYIALHQGIYDFRGSLLGDKACSVLFNNMKIKSLAPHFHCLKGMKEGLEESVRYMCTHMESQREDEEFNLWCNELLRGMD